MSTLLRTSEWKEARLNHHVLRQRGAREQQDDSTWQQADPVLMSLRGPGEREIHHKPVDFTAFSVVKYHFTAAAKQAE